MITQWYVIIGNVIYLRFYFCKATALQMT